MELAKNRSAGTAVTVSDTSTSRPASRQTHATRPPHQSDHHWHLVEIRESPGKGLGVFAKQPIKAGTRVLLERPIVTIPPRKTAEHARSLITEAIDILPEIRNLPQSDLYKILALSPYPNHPVVQHLMQWGLDSLEPPPAAEEWIALGIILNNKIGNSIYLEGSRFNHSCLPNVIARQHESDETKGALTVHARKQIEAGEELFTTYIDHFLPNDDRRAALKPFGFTCTCDACCGPRVEHWEQSRNSLIEASLNAMPFAMTPFVAEGWHHLDEDELVRLQQLMDASSAWCKASQKHPEYCEEAYFAFINAANLWRVVNNPLMVACCCGHAMEQVKRMRGADHPVREKLWYTIAKLGTIDRYRKASVEDCPPWASQWLIHSEFPILDAYLHWKAHCEFGSEFWEGTPEICIAVRRWRCQI